MPVAPLSNRRHVALRVRCGPLYALVMLFPVPTATAAARPTVTAQNPATQNALPSTPAGRAAAAYLVAFNAGEGAMRAFIREFRSAAYLETNPVDGQVRFYSRMRDGVGDLSLDRFVAASDFEIVVVATTTRRPPGVLTLRFRVDSVAPNPLAVLNITPGAVDASLDAVVIDSATLGRMIDALASLLRDTYVFPEMGGQLAELLVANTEAGRYAGITNGTALAQRISAHLRARSQDAHLGVVFGRLPTGRGQRPGQTSAAGSDAVREVRILADSIGYLRLDRFERHELSQTRDAIAGAMAVVRPAAALVIDLRSNQGGDPETAEWVAGYLFDRRTSLGTMYRRRGDSREFRSADVRASERFGADRPVYVLTSRQTASAAETFTLALQDLRRAAVVGGTTAGSCHPSTDVAVTDLFWVRMPYARTLSPVSRRDCEGAGVTPDIRVPEDSALDAALQDARRRLAPRRAR